MVEFDSDRLETKSLLLQQVGDPVETYAIMKALRPNKSRPLLMGCLKSNMGHSEGASALCGMSKVALIFQRGIIPPNIK